MSSSCCRWRDRQQAQHVRRIRGHEPIRREGAPERREPDELLDGRDELKRVERLAHEGIRAFGERADAGIVGAADRDDRNVPRLLVSRSRSQ